MVGLIVRWIRDAPGVLGVGRRPLGGVALVVLVLGAEEVIENVDDGGDVSFRLSIAVLQRWIKSACN